MTNFSSGVSGTMVQNMPERPGGDVLYPLLLNMRSCVSKNKRLSFTLFDESSSTLFSIGLFATWTSCDVTLI